MQLALFDFDGTLTPKDSMLEYIKYTHGSAKFYLALMVLSPMLVLFTIGIVSNDKAKQMLLRYFYKGWDVDRMTAFGDQFATEVVPTIISANGNEWLKWHQEQGHRIVIVTASASVWLKAWCAANQLELIATELEVQHGKITGKYQGKNCRGEEKVQRIQAAIPLNDYEYIYAYGDSKSDKPMLALAHKAHFGRL